MAFRTKFDGQTDKTIALGGDRDGKKNPTSIEGYFLGSKTTQSDYGPGLLHMIQTEDGVVGVWGKTRLNNLLTKELTGQMVKIDFTGMIAPVKKGRRPAYGYKVQHDPDNTTDVSGIDLNPVETLMEAEEGQVEENDYSTEEPQEEPQEEVPAPRAVAPKQAAQAPNAAAQARVKALLASRKSA